MNTDSSSEAVFKPALLLMIGRVLGFLVSFAIPVVLVRMFDQSEFGTYKQLFLVYGTLFGIAQVGMAESLFYFLPAAGIRGGNYVLNTILALGAAGGVCLLLLWTGQSVIAGWLNNGALEHYIPLVGVYLFVMLMAAVLEIVMTAQKHHLRASVAYAASDLTRAALYILPLIIVNRLEWLLFGAIVFGSIRFTAALIYVAREYRGGLRPDAVLMRRQLGYAVPFGIAVFIEVIQANLHMYAVSFHFDAATFAIYAVGVLQIPVFDFMMTSTGNVMMVKMREKLGAGDHDAVLRIWRDATRKLALVFFPMAGGLLVVADELIVVLFTEDYAGSVPVFMVWTLSLLFMFVLTDPLLRVFAQTRFLIFLNLARLLLVAGLVGWFLESLGLLGAVLVTLLATVVAKVAGLMKARALLRTSVTRLMPWGALIEITAITACAAGLALAAKSALALPDAALMVAAGLVFAASFLSLLFMFGPMSSDEKLELWWWARWPFVRLGRNFKA